MTQPVMHSRWPIALYATLAEKEIGQNLQQDRCQLVACHECDLVTRRVDIPTGARADCARCGALLYRNIANAHDKAIALYLATLMCMAVANLFPFIKMQAGGVSESSLVATGSFALYEFGQAEIGLVVLLTSIVFPLLCVCGILYLLIPARFGWLAPLHGPVFRMVQAMEPFSLLSVFMLGTLIAIVKLQSLAAVSPGIGLYGFVCMLVLYSAARANFDAE